MATTRVAPRPRSAGRAKVPLPRKSQAAESGRLPAICVEYSQAQQLVDGAEDDQRDQRGQEGAQAQVADQHAVDRAEQRAAQQRARPRRRPTGHLPHVHHHQRAEVGQREHRAHRQVDAADDHHQRQAQHDEADLAGLAQGVGQRRRRVEVADQPARERAPRSAAAAPEWRSRSSAWTGSRPASGRATSGSAAGSASRPATRARRRRRVPAGGGRVRAQRLRHRAASLRRQLPAGAFLGRRCPW